MENGTCFGCTYTVFCHPKLHVTSITSVSLALSLQMPVQLWFSRLIRGTKLENKHIYTIRHARFALEAGDHSDLH
jgi:hypothetical protein